MTTELRLPGGEVATLLDFDGEDRLRILAGRPFPPGTRLSTATDHFEVRGKVVHVRRGQREGEFVVALKLTDVTRDARRRLRELALDPSP